MPEVVLGCGPEGCPECGDLQCSLGEIQRDRMTKTCVGCGHTWLEERLVPIEAPITNLVFRKGYINVVDLERVVDLRRGVPK